MGAESIQSRLSDACRTLAVLGEADFAGDDDRDLFRRIWSAVASRSHGGEMGAIEATIQEMDDEAAVAVARDLVTLYSQAS